MIEAQNARILAYLKTGRSITPIDALDCFGCFRLGARIYDLKQAGHTIESDFQEAEGKRFKRYWLAGGVTS